MNDAPQIGRPTRPVVIGWAVFLLVVVVATILFGPLALLILAMVAGLALIGTGIRSSGWPRPVLIVVGVLILLTPILILIDESFGHWVVTVR